MATIVYTILLIVSCLFLVRKQVGEESYFSLKIVGYFILGSFAFYFNEMALPAGFLIYLLIFRPKLNRQIKQNAAFLGVLTFLLIHWILPFVLHDWESRSINIELGAVSNMNFDDGRLTELKN